MGSGFPHLLRSVEEEDEAKRGSSTSFELVRRARVRYDGSSKKVGVVGPYAGETRNSGGKGGARMNNTSELRWRQRFENFEKAFLLLKEALEAKPLDEYSKLEQDGVVQRFEYTFELAWKTLKDRLLYEGHDEKTPRAVIRRSFSVGYLSEEGAETWLESLAKSNLLGHTYFSFAWKYRNY